MSASATSLVPPAVKTKSDSSNGAAAIVPPGEKPAKAKREPKVKAEGGEKKPRNVISFPKTAIVRLVSNPEKEVKFRGKRADYFETLSKHDGKTVEELLTAFKNKNDEKGGGPGAWLRWFFDEGLVKVEEVPTAQ